MWNAWLESRLQGEISVISDMQMTPLFGRKKRGTKEPLDEGERRKWKSWLKTQHSKNEDHGIWSHHFLSNALEKEKVTHSSVLAWRIPWMGEPGGLPSMGSHRVRHDWSNLAAAAACQIEWQTLFSWSPKSLQMVTAAMKLKDAASLEERYDKPRQHVKKQKHYFANKGPSKQSYGFSGCHVWMWELDHKEAECGRADAFELWCWRRLLRVPRTARRSNQSILKEINPGYSLEGLMLKREYFGHLMRKTDSLEKTLMLERLKAKGEEGSGGWDGWIASLTQWTWNWVDSRR